MKGTQEKMNTKNLINLVQEEQQTRIMSYGELLDQLKEVQAEFLPCMDKMNATNWKDKTYYKSYKDFKILYSYDTALACFNTATMQLTKLYDGYSFTSQRHLNSFLKLLKGYQTPNMRKQDWLSLDTTPIYKTLEI